MKVLYPLSIMADAPTNLSPQGPLDQPMQSSQPQPVATPPQPTQIPQPTSPSTELLQEVSSTNTEALAIPTNPLAGEGPTPAEPITYSAGGDSQPGNTPETDQKFSSQENMGLFGSKKLLFIIGGIILVAAIAAGAFFFLSKNSSESAPQTTPSGQNKTTTIPPAAVVTPPPITQRTTSGFSSTQSSTTPAQKR